MQRLNNFPPINEPSLTWLSSACYTGGDQFPSRSPLEGSKDFQAGTHNTGVAGREIGGVPASSAGA